MFSEIAPFLQNQFTQKLICDLISQLIFKLSSTNLRFRQSNFDGVYYVQLILVFS